MEEPYLITGCQKYHDGMTYPRLEIRDLRKKTEQFTLFILSLVQIMKREHRPKASRFADLGGIHGLPYERWIGDPDVKDSSPEGTWGGYCNHGSVLFPSWHRPYLLAIEQSIGEAAIRLARQLTKHENDGVKATWKKAAQELRFPFWDWTDARTGREGLPDILHNQTFTFDLPGGVKSDPIDNPLAFYEFGSEGAVDGFTNNTWKNMTTSVPTTSYFKDWRRTYRWPSGKENPIEDYVKLKELSPTLCDISCTDRQRGYWHQIRTDVANLFTFPATAKNGQGSFIWDEFSNYRFQSKDKTKWDPCGISSIEVPHNFIHVLIGGLGNMSDNDYAGFDPIFYLHHCNIDRILAFWEYVYADYWMGDGYINKNGNLVPFSQHDGTWGEDDDAKSDQFTSLQPFRKGDQKYWDGSSARFLQKDLKVKKWYTYPPIGAVSVDAPLPSTLTMRKEYIRILQNHFQLPLWNYSGPSHPLLANLTQAHAPPEGHTKIPNYCRFVVDVDVHAYAFNGSYILQLVHREEVVSSFTVLSRRDDSQCAACKLRNAAGGKVGGVMDIPDDVVSAIIENDPHASTGAFIKALKGSFSVRIVGPSGLPLALTTRETKTFADGPPPGSALDERIIPNLKLRTAAAAADAAGHVKGQEALHGPAVFFGWADHGNLLDDGINWVTA